ncbi:hypothetical protein ACFL0X_00640 [Nanoarchaeota archaeon]
MTNTLENLANRDGNVLEEVSDQSGVFSRVYDSIKNKFIAPLIFSVGLVLASPVYAGSCLEGYLWDDSLRDGKGGCKKDLNYRAPDPDFSASWAAASGVFRAFGGNETNPKKTIGFGVLEGVTRAIADNERAHEDHERASKRAGITQEVNVHHSGDRGGNSGSKLPANVYIDSQGNFHPAPGYEWADPNSSDLEVRGKRGFYMDGGDIYFADCRVRGDVKFIIEKDGEIIYRERGSIRDPNSQYKMDVPEEIMQKPGKYSVGILWQKEGEAMKRYFEQRISF